MIIKAANQKLSALISVVMLMADFNRKDMFNFFIRGQFNYCPLLWVFSTTAVNHKITRLPERGFRALLSDKISTFIKMMTCDDMLSKSNDTTIHEKNIQKTMTEFYQYLYGPSAPIMSKVFTKRNLKYYVRNCRVTLLPNLKPKDTAPLR